MVLLNNTALIGENVPSNLKDFLKTNQNSNLIQRVSNEDGSEATFQSVLSVRSLLNNQTLIINTVFSVAPFDKKLADLQMLLILIQVIFSHCLFYCLCLELYPISQSKITQSSTR